MQIFCINLDRSADRLAHIQSVFLGLGQEFTRISAVDGGLLAQSELEFYGARAVHALTKGEIGCFLSHVAVWRQIAEGDAPFAVVFEDDVQVSRHLSAFLNELKPLTALPYGADLIKLETMGTRVTLGRKPLGAVAGTALHLLCSRHLGAAGYVMSRKAALYWSQKAEKMTFPADYIFLNDQLEFKTFQIVQTVPALVMQDHYYGVIGGASDFGSMIDQMSAARKRNLLSVAAKIRRELGRGLRKFKTSVVWSVTMQWLRFRRLKVRFRMADRLIV